ncbi:precorrin-6y C5,15-methyltransferase (decarboxylating) subunit CbiE [Aeromicrobium sp.]|uniref:precorrin-6y C5,15-methyltransferase (decarboxylating) subunit CbiE n=1 Tax=Aeromicrobium sp. TaxID=1871063 RepID=UPI003C62BAAC
MEKVVVVGIGADGWLGPAHLSAIASADVVLGGERQLALLPSGLTVERRTWPSPLRAGLASLFDELAGRRVVALASGDPLLSGIGSTLIELLGPDRVEIRPNLSSVAIARARMGWAAETVEVVRDHGTLPRHLAPGRRVLVLSADGSIPAQVAELLTEAGYGDSAVSVLADLGSTHESRVDGVAAAWSEASAPALNIVAVTCGEGPVLGWTAGLPDDAFDHDGQITKRDLRASALARLAPVPGHLLWDVGAGAGSIAVEWMRTHPTCRAIAVESREDRAKRISSNATALGVPGLVVVAGHAPEALAGLEAPDAIFVGGGATEPGLLDACWDALAPGGRIVVHGVTLETENVLAGRYAAVGGELSRLHIEHAAPIGSYTGWTPSRAITQWSATKTESTAGP